ncbi:hypothetical protein ORFS12 [Halorubrum tailed virus]|nr:hypothetical protein ORFS12 [Halorubrum tailed virus]
MVLNIDIGDGADALAQNQYIGALGGTYLIDGWDATLGAGDLEVDIAAGSGTINGGNVSTGATQTVDFTGDVDGTEPRKAVISVDETGMVQKTIGETTPPKPVGVLRFRTYDPAPPPAAPGVVVAEVWLDAGVASLESSDVRDRRVTNQAAQSATSTPFTKTVRAETFEEPDLTLTHTNSEVASESVQIAGTVNGSTADPTDPSYTGNSTSPRGLVINPNRTLSGVETQVNADVSGVTTLRLVSDSDESLIASKSISGSGTYSITADTPLEPGARYRVVVDADGAPYTDARGSVNTASATSSDVDVVEGCLAGSVTSRTMCLNYVTAVYESTSGTAYIERPYPPDVHSWDAATFQATPDGETVEVFVEESTDDGTTWDEIQGPISRGDQIVAPPSAAVRFRVGLSREDTSNNPTLDSIYLRYEV